MLIIVAGLLLSVGITQMSLFGSLGNFDRYSSNYAESIQAKNVAYAAIELAQHEMRGDHDWRSGSREYFIDGFNALIELEPVGGDSLRIISTGYVNEFEQVITMLLLEENLDFVPEFKAAVGIATDDFNLSLGGNALLNGHDAGGVCESVPGLTIPPQTSGIISGIIGGLFGGSGESKHIDGNPKGKAEEEELDFDPAAQLIDRLANQSGITYLSGNYKGSMGSAENPGVFFVESPTKLTGGIDEGFGIMVVRTNGELELDGELDLAGNFNFNGLIIFENAFEVKGRGTPSIRGAMLIGKTENVGTIDIDFSGNINIQYDCEAQKYAKLASANIQQIKAFRTLSVFEE